LRFSQNSVGAWIDSTGIWYSSTYSRSLSGYWLAGSMETMTSTPS